MGLWGNMGPFLSLTLFRSFDGPDHDRVIISSSDALVHVQLFMSKVSTWRWSSSLAKNLQVGYLALPFSIPSAPLPISSPPPLPLQEYQEVPADSDPYVVASTLMHTLRSLPEPLLTFKRYHAFQGSR